MELLDISFIDHAGNPKAYIRYRLANGEEVKLKGTYDKGKCIENVLCVLLPAEKAKSFVLANSDILTHMEYDEWSSAYVQKQKDSIDVFYCVKIDEFIGTLSWVNFKSAFEVWANAEEGILCRCIVNYDGGSPLNTEVILENKPVLFSDLSAEEISIISCIEDKTNKDIIEDIYKCHLARAKAKLPNGKINLTLVEKAREDIQSYITNLQSLLTNTDISHPAVFSTNDEKALSLFRVAYLVPWFNHSDADKEMHSNQFTLLINSPGEETLNQMKACFPRDEVQLLNFVEDV